MAALREEPPMPIPSPNPGLFQSPRRPVSQPATGQLGPRPGTVEDLERIIADVLPAAVPTDLMSRRGTRAQQTWANLTVTPLYEALTIWVMAAWPEQMLERVDTMVRTAIAFAHHVGDGQWSTMRLIGVVHKAGQRPEHREEHRHLGRAVSLVSYDAVPLELADETPRSRPVSSLGPGVVADLRLALGEHRYMVTPSAAALLDASADIAVDHLNAIAVKSLTNERPDGLCGLALFAAARPSKRANKSNRITEVFRDLPRPTAVALSHLLLGTDYRPEASLLWRHASGLSPLNVPAMVVADWRADLPSLCPSILAYSERRRRRLRDRSRKGDDLRRVFEMATLSDFEDSESAMAI
jgi:hypothetical protein